MDDPGEGGRSSGSKRQRVVLSGEDLASKQLHKNWPYLHHSHCIRENLFGAVWCYGRVCLRGISRCSVQKQGKVRGAVHTIRLQATWLCVCVFVCVCVCLCMSASCFLSPVLSSPRIFRFPCSKFLLRSQQELYPLCSQVPRKTNPIKMSNQQNSTERSRAWCTSVDASGVTFLHE